MGKSRGAGLRYGMRSFRSFAISELGQFASKTTMHAIIWRYRNWRGVESYLASIVGRNRQVDSMFLFYFIFILFFFFILFISDEILSHNLLFHNNLPPFITSTTMDNNNIEQAQLTPYTTAPINVEGGNAIVAATFGDNADLCL